MENLQTTRTWAEISLEALRHNARELRAAVGEDCILLGVVKADAYGHGAPLVAKTLREEGCGYLAVACVQEALALRAAGETLPMLILGAVDAEYAPLMADGDVTLAVECAEKGRALSAALAPGQRLKIHIKLDTGMGRLGFPAGDRDALKAAAEVMGLPGLEPEGVFTHFAVSDTPGGEDYTEKQFALFTAAAAELERLSGKKLRLRHCANSGGVLSFRDKGYCLDMVRPGILTYGIYPDAERGGLDLVPVMTLKSRVSAVKRYPAGTRVSYGGTFITQRETRMGVIPIGYADGLHRTLSNQARFWTKDGFAPQRGRICMDMCMIDLTELPGVGVGDEVEIFGEHADLEALAAQAGTISYELLCAVSPRVPRIYL